MDTAPKPRATKYVHVDIQMELVATIASRITMGINVMTAHSLSSVVLAARLGSEKSAILTVSQFQGRPGLDDLLC